MAMGPIFFPGFITCIASEPKHKKHHSFYSFLYAIFAAKFFDP